MKILIVDSEKEFIRKYAPVLRLNDFNPIAVDTNKEAIKYLHSDSAIKLIICCITSRNSRTPEFIHYVRDNLRFNHIHVLVISNTTDKDNVLNCLKLGIKDYLVMPLSKDFLIERIHKAMVSCYGSVLLAADDEVMLSLLSKTIQRENYRVLAARSAMDAVKIVKSEKIDIVIADIALPPASGLDLMVQVKEYSPLTPVVIITEYLGKLNREHVIQAGADSYIEKPFHNTQIRRTLMSLISQANKRRFAQNR